MYQLLLQAMDTDCHVSCAFWLQIFPQVSTATNASATQ